MSRLSSVTFCTVLSAPNAHRRGPCKDLKANHHQDEQKAMTSGGHFHVSGTLTLGSRDDLDDFLVSDCSTPTNLKTLVFTAAPT